MGSTHDSQYLTFTLGGERYAASVKQVQEVVECSDITRLPQQGQAMIGLMNLRGSGVPVIALRDIIGLSERKPSLNTAIIVLETAIADKTIHVGALVDEVHEVVDFPAAAIVQPPRLGAFAARHYIKGIAKDEAGFVIILEMDRVLDMEGSDSLAESLDRGSLDGFAVDETERRS